MTKRELVMQMRHLKGGVQRARLLPDERQTVADKLEELHHILVNVELREATFIACRLEELGYSNENVLELVNSAIT